MPESMSEHESVVTVQSEDVRSALSRVLASDLFAKSPQLSRFLRFCVEETLAGRQDSLKEQVLGTDVFRRASPFDPRLDPIVRVEARRLRAKLDQYYATDGATDPILISFQRGEYVPRFVRALSGHGPAPVARSARVMIVEDERIVAKDLEMRLKHLGYQVVGTAASGETALLQIAEAQPDIVLMDIVLAGVMRGTEVARRIWNELRIPVVYLTAFSDAFVLEDVKGSQPYGYVLKPFDSKQLHAVLQLAMSRRERERAEAVITPATTSSERLFPVLAKAGVEPWQWLVLDASLPWPEAVGPLADAQKSTGSLTPIEFLDRISPTDRANVRAAFTRAIRNREPLQVAYSRTCDSGTDKPVVSIGVVVPDATGRLRCSGIEIDASSLMRPDQESKIAELEQFVLAAGHDLQEPLRTVKAYTQLLARRRKEADPPPDTLVTFIQGGVDQMHALVTNLLSFTRLAGEPSVPIETLTLDEPLDLALQNLRAAINESGARIHRSPLPVVTASKQQMVQLFQNLISNAMKYHQADLAPEISISAEPSVDQWRIAIQDNGAGFDAAYEDRVFEPFKRLDSKGVPGAGLGLAICRRIVERHGGRIWAESHKGKGTTFYFTLPAASSSS